MKILIAGDFCPLHRVAKIIGTGEFDVVFGEVKDLTSQFDYSIVNLECPIVEEGNGYPIEKVGPVLKCNVQAIEAIRYGGFDCVTLANNHFLDYGDDGVKTTLQLCQANNIDYVGGGKNLGEATRTLFKKIGSKTLAIVNCCEHEFSIAGEKKAGSNPLNPIQQYYAIQEAKEKAEYVLVIVHGGHEHYQLPSPRMVETYRFFIDAGADAVVNHHQHCLSGFERYNGKPIFYGLGNFCFDRPKKDAKWHYGLLASITFDTEVAYDYIPFLQCQDEPAVKIIGKGEIEEILMALNAFIINPSRLKEETNRYFHNAMKQLETAFGPISNRWINALQRRGFLPSLLSRKKKISFLSYIQCESNRDKLEFFLKS